LVDNNSHLSSVPAVTSLFRVVLLGKSNVGKSTLFNALTNSQSSIVSFCNATTRDSINRVLKNDRDRGVIMISDLPGWDDGKFLNEQIKEDRKKIAPFIVQKLKYELSISDIVLLVVDIEKVTSEDKDLYRYIVQSGIPIIVCANKCDNNHQKNLIGEIYEWGVDEVVIVSAKLKKGISYLIKLIFNKKQELLFSHINSKNKHFFYRKTDFRLALIGRPNAGKSSLFNILLGKERSLVSDIAGTTRDLVEDFWNNHNQNIKIIDTAGLRKKHSIRKKIVEKLSLQKTNHAINQSDIILLLIDALDNISERDKKIIFLASKKKKSLLIVFNKWDQIEGSWKNYHKDLLRTFPPIKDFIIIPISCKSGKNIDKLSKEIKVLFSKRCSEISTGELNRILKIAMEHNPPPIRLTNRPFKIYYAVQVSTSPPVFFFYINSLKKLSRNYHQYLIGYLEKHLVLRGVSIVIRYFEKKATSIKQ
jgi:GTP-binding protein